VSEALRELAPDNSRRAADFWIGMSPAAEDLMDVRIAWTPRAGLDGKAPAGAVTVRALQAEDQLFEGSSQGDGLRFQAAPGSVNLDLTIRDTTGEVMDREQRTISVPHPGDVKLALTTPILSRARNAAEVRALLEDPSPAPFAGREFSRTERVLVRVVPYGSASAGATVTAQLLGRLGNTLAELPVNTARAGAGYQVDLPLTSLAAGEFLIALAARTSADSVETYVPIRIGR
jgi:hypothetical protein